jgi:AcrR family transcriptional regulator
MAYRRTAPIQARLDAQRSAILGAAIELVAERGYAACSMAAVAACADVATGTVYRHFAGKAELVTELFRTVVTREVDAVRAAAAGPGSVSDRAGAVIDTFAGRALKAPRLAYALLAEPVDPAVDALRLTFRVAYRDVIADLIATGVANGELPPQDPEVVAAALVGAIAEALVGPLSSGRENGTGVDPGAVPNLISFALRGLGVLDDTHARGHQPGTTAGRSRHRLAPGPLRRPAP